MTGVPSVRIDGHVVWVTPHAVGRYRDRVCPWLTYQEVHAQLVTQLRAVGTWQYMRPSFLRDRPDGTIPAHTTGFVMLGPGIVFPVIRQTLTTCLTQGGLSEAARDRRKAKRLRKRRMRAIGERGTAGQARHEFGGEAA
jgi:hypothetical protein